MSGAAERVTDMTRGLRNVARRGDPLDEWQRQCIGRAAQLRIPLRDQVDLRRCAAILRNLANRLEVMSEPRRFEECNALLQAKGEVSAAQGRMQSDTKG